LGASQRLGPSSRSDPLGRGVLTIDMATPRYQSVGLGANVGAFNSIEVLAGVPITEGEPNIVHDYVFFGSSGYVYGFVTVTYQIGQLHH